MVAENNIICIEQQCHCVSVKWSHCNVSLLLESMGFIHNIFGPCISVRMRSFHLSEVSRGLALQVDV